MNRNPGSHRSLFWLTAAFLAVAAPIVLSGDVSPMALVFGADQAPADQTHAKKPAPKKPVAKPAGKAPESPAQPAKPEDAPAAAPDQGSTSLSFTDDDLEKYHKPKPAPEADEEVASPVTGAAPGIPGAPAPGIAAKPAAAKAPAAKTPPAKTAVKKPKPNVIAPPDPATLALAKSALDAARERELKARRDRIEGFEARLQYLRAKRDAILNPTGSQMGTTGPRAFQYDQNGKPVLDPNTGKPVTKPDISPGRGTAPVAPIFVPLPEAQTDEDRERDKTMKVKDLLTAVEAEIKSVEADLDSAKTDLIDYETRFAPGTGAP